MPGQEPIDEYLKIQGRFKVLGLEAATGFQNNVERSWQRLIRKYHNAA